MERIDRRRLWLWAPAVAWASLVLIGSLVDPPGSPTAGTGPFSRFPADVWQHGVGYAVLGALVARALDRPSVTGAALAVVLTVAVGAGVELLQTVVPYRTAALGDAVANTVGATVGVVTWLVSARTLPRH